jgi:hypothetical protein
MAPGRPSLRSLELHRYSHKAVLQLRWALWAAKDDPASGVPHNSALIEKKPQLRGRERAAGLLFEYRSDLIKGYSGKPFDELVNRCPVFKIRTTRSQVRVFRERATRRCSDQDPVRLRHMMTNQPCGKANTGTQNPALTFSVTRRRKCRRGCLRGRRGWR